MDKNKTFLKHLVTIVTLVVNCYWVFLKSGHFCPLYLMNGPRRTACFAKGMPNYSFSILNSIRFSYTLAIGLYILVQLTCQTRSQTDVHRDNGQIFVSLRLLTSLCETIKWHMFYWALFSDPMFAKICMFFVSCETTSYGFYWGGCLYRDTVLL